MSNEMQLKFIEIYSMVCDFFGKNPQWKFIRLSNNVSATLSNCNQPAQFYLYFTIFFLILFQTIFQQMRNFKLK